MSEETVKQYGVRWNEYPDDPVEQCDSARQAQDIAAIYKSQRTTVVQRTVTYGEWEAAS